MTAGESLRHRPCASGDHDDVTEDITIAIDAATQVARATRPGSVLGTASSVARSQGRATKHLICRARWLYPTWSSMVLDGGAIPSSVRCISPVRWHFCGAGGIEPSHSSRCVPARNT